MKTLMILLCFINYSCQSSKSSDNPSINPPPNVNEKNEKTELNDSHCKINASRDFFTQSGEIYSVREFSYGLFTATMEYSPKSGVIASFFLFDNNSPVHEEIDFEIVGTRVLQTNARKIPSDDTQFSSIRFGKTVEFSILWLPKEIKWYVDGNLIRTKKISFPTPKKIHFNLWSSGYCPWAGDLHFPWNGEKHHMKILKVTYSQYKKKTNTFVEPISLPFTYNTSLPNVYDPSKESEPLKPVKDEWNVGEFNGIPNHNAEEEHLDDPIEHIKPNKHSDESEFWSARCGTWDDFNLTLFHPNGVQIGPSDMLITMNEINPDWAPLRKKIYAGYCP